MEGIKTFGISSMSNFVVERQTFCQEVMNLQNTKIWIPFNEIFFIDVYEYSFLITVQRRFYGDFGLILS